MDFLIELIKKVVTAIVTYLAKALTEEVFESATA